MRRQTILSLLCACLVSFTTMQAQTLLDHDFSSVSQFEAYTVIDANGDYQTWEYDDLFLAASCPRDYDADDWLLTPRLQLQAGKTYRLTLNASVDQEGEEQLSVLMGQGTRVADMQTVLVAQTGITSMYSESRTAVFTVAADGYYYIGFHCSTTGDPFSNRLYLRRIRVEETANQGVPAGVTEFTVTPATDGSLQATVALRTPDKNIGGTSLTELTRVDLYRGGQLVHTFQSPGMGQVVSFVDTPDAPGQYTYRAVPVNSLGEGEAAQRSAYVGSDLPGPVTNLRFVYDHAAQQSVLTWDAPTEGANGGYLNPEGLTYVVRRFRAPADSQVAAGLTEGSFTEPLDINYLIGVEDSLRQVYAALGMPYSGKLVYTGEGLMQYYVRAVTPQGAGAETVSNYQIIGEPQQLPYEESFAGGSLTHYWRTDLRTSLDRWSLVNDSRYNQDGDGGMLGFAAIDGTGTATAHTGNIAMKTATNPVLSFYYLYGEPMAKPLTIKVSRDGADFEPLATIDLTDVAAKDQYQRATVPLTGCAGCERIQIAFEAQASTTVDVLYVDHVTVIDQCQWDLAISQVSLPRNLKVGEMRYLTASVSNLGLSDVVTGAYSVDVYVDGQKAGTAMGMAVAADQTVSTMVPVSANIDMQRQSDIYAEVVFAADQSAVNNRSDVARIDVKLPTYPAATNLQAAVADQGVALSWAAPAAPRQTDGQVTDSFEQYDDFQHTNFGDWTLVDLDRRLTYGVGGYSFPDNSEIMAYMVFNPSAVLNTTTNSNGMTGATWQPRTGEKLLASFSAYDNISDDWLISPELSGNAQVVSFYAHHALTASEEVPERFQFYISTSGYETTNFMALDQTPRTTSSEWTRYEYALPQGSKYFAIRHVTDDGWALFIDDVTFVPDTLAAQPSLMLYGYNVYRNGERLNQALVAQPTFTDPDGQPGDVYRVTAIYNAGESVYSNDAVAIVAEAIQSVPVLTTAPAATYDLGGRRQQTPKGITVVKGRKHVSK